MDLEDFFKKKHKNHKKYEMRNSHHYDSYGYKPYYKTDKFKLFEFLKIVKTNKKLRIIALVTGLIIMAVIIGLIIITLPLIVKFFNYIAQNGVSGVIEDIMAFLKRLWYGA